MQPVELLAQACELAGKQVDAATSCPTAATPCTEFDATQLVSHMVAALQFNVALLTNTPPKGDPFNPAQLDPKNMAQEYKAAAGELIAAASADGAMDAPVNHPASPEPIPGSAAIMFPTFDMYVHAWDLSQATGLEAEMPEELHAAVDGWCQQVFAGERQPGVVGPAVPAPEGATSMQQLAAFLGRSS